MDQAAGYSLPRLLAARARERTLAQLHGDGPGVAAARDLELDVLARVVAGDDLREVIRVLDRRTADLRDHVPAGAERGRLEAGLLPAAADAGLVGRAVRDHVLDP